MAAAWQRNGNAMVTARYRNGKGMVREWSGHGSGERIVDAHGRVSRVTTAGGAPSVDAYLLMAYLPPEYAVVGTDLLVMYMNETFPVQVAVAGPGGIFDPADSRMKS